MQYYERVSNITFGASLAGAKLSTTLKLTSTVNSMLQKLIHKVIGVRIIYLRLSKNKMEIKDLATGKSISKTSIKKFSNNRLLIADFLIAESFFRNTLKELLIDERSILSKPIKVFIQIVDSEIQDITPVEERIYRDFAEHGGASYVWLYDQQGVLTDEEVKEIMK